MFFQSSIPLTDPHRLLILDMKSYETGYENCFHLFGAAAQALPDSQYAHSPKDHRPYSWFWYRFG